MCLPGQIVIPYKTESWGYGIQVQVSYVPWSSDPCYLLNDCGM